MCGESGLSGGGGGLWLRGFMVDGASIAALLLFLIIVVKLN